MVPDLRPSRPLSNGPTRFLAASPTVWQAAHFLNEVSPAATSPASATPTDPRSTAPATAMVLIMYPILLFACTSMGMCSERLVQTGVVGLEMTGEPCVELL